MGLIIILGAPNDDDGQLSRMAHGRVALGYQLYRERQAAGWRLLLTGGFGAHFNRTALPHAAYLQQWLLAHGVPPDDMVEFALSRHTGEDARLALPIVERLGVRQLLVVTSDFHLARAEFIFRSVFPTYGIELVGAPYLPTCSSTEQAGLIAHEARRLASLRESKLSG